jgi:hypothetical protein
VEPFSEEENFLFLAFEERSLVGVVDNRVLGDERGGFLDL